jgi:hypothetical protein
MLLGAFDDREVEILILALRYWRAQRRSGVMRRADPFITPDTIDVLLAKLGSASFSSVPPDDPSDEFLAR